MTPETQALVEQILALRKAMSPFVSVDDLEMSVSEWLHQANLRNAYHAWIQPLVLDGKSYYTYDQVEQLLSPKAFERCQSTPVKVFHVAGVELYEVAEVEARETKGG